MTLQRRLTNQLLLLGVGLTSGLMVRRVFNHYLGASRNARRASTAARHRRPTPTGEIDAALAAHGSGSAARQQLRAAGVRAGPPGSTRREFEPGVAEQNRADRQAHRPFRDLRVRWRRADGSVLHLLVSGEPCFDAAGASSATGRDARCRYSAGARAGGAAPFRAGARRW